MVLPLVCIWKQYGWIVTQSKRTYADREGTRDDEIDRLIEQCALQRQQREVDEHLLAMTRAERMRRLKRRRYQWICHHIELAEIALQNGQHIAEKHYEQARRLGWKPGMEVNGWPRR